MKDFVDLYKNIDETTSTNAKVAALVDYFASDASEQDKLWTIGLFTHRKPPRAVNTTLLRTWTAEQSAVPTWLFEDTYHLVGDLAETIALVLPRKNRDLSADLSLSGLIGQLKYIKTLDDESKKEKVLDLWSQMDNDERFLFNKLITGGFRLGVSQKLLTKALSIHLKEDESRIAHKLMGEWTPETTTWSKLFEESMGEADISRPYPFFLAYAVEGAPEDIGPAEEWVAEFKWDGIRGQLIKRRGKVFLWSRGEELVTDKYPEFDAVAGVQADDFVLDGEILAFKDGMPLSFNDLQTRIGRKSPGGKLLREKPVVFMAYDLLEYEGEDVRSRTYGERRELLAMLLENMAIEDLIIPSSYYTLPDWEYAKNLREQASDQKAEGLMLKQLSSQYLTGRKKGGWWKWKIDPLTVDAVMIYAQRGHGRRASLYTDFTFAVKGDGGVLLPFTKAYSGLTDDEFREVTTYVRNHTIEKFGPVVSVVPQLVFEIAFEGIAASGRHKSGVALRFPRIKRWRKDKSVEEINHIDDLKALL